MRFMAIIFLSAWLAHWHYFEELTFYNYVPTIYRSAFVVECYPSKIVVVQAQRIVTTEIIIQFTVSDYSLQLILQNGFLINLFRVLFFASNLQL